MGAEWSACLQTLEGHSGSAKSVTFSHDSTRLASASDDCTINIWDSGSITCLQTLKGHSCSAKSVTFSHDSTRLASGSDDGTIKIWDASSGICLQTLDSHYYPFCSVAFSRDSTRLASVSWAPLSHDTVIIWDVGSGARLQTLNIGKNVGIISFDTTSSCLLTDIGIIAIDTPSVLDTTTQGLGEYNGPQYQGVGLSSDRKWITCNSERLVWLPSEYRPSCSAVSGMKIVIGTGVGNVWVYNL